MKNLKLFLTFLLCVDRYGGVDLSSLPESEKRSQAGTQMSSYHAHEHHCSVRV